MAFKRSAVRSRLSPPNTEAKASVFLLLSEIEPLDLKETPESGWIQVLFLMAITKRWDSSLTRWRRGAAKQKKKPPTYVDGFGGDNRS